MTDRTDRITKLTDAQKARFPHYIRKWTDIGLSTEPIDRARHDAAIKAVYKLSGLDAPRIVYADCALSGAIAAAVLATKDFVSVWQSVEQSVWQSVEQSVWLSVEQSVGQSVEQSVWLSVEQSVGQSVWQSVGQSVRQSVGQSVGLKWVNWLYENMWAGYAAWADFFRTECGVTINPDCLAMMQYGHYIWPLSGVCIASEKPAAIHTDDQGRSHCETGPAVVYPSGWGPFCWHGVVVPSEWIMDKPPSAADALRVENMEQRRAACEMIGWVNILDELNATTIDKHTNPMAGELVEVDIPDVGRERFLRVRCGTNRMFALPVPPDIQTVEQSQRWLNFIPDDVPFLPEVRT